MRTAEIDQALLTSISEERLQKYLAHANGVLSAGLEMYEKNMRLSEAFYVSLQTLEISLRNKLDAEMSQFYGPDWLRNDAVAPLTDHSRSMINEGLRSVHAPDAPNGKLVAELKFAFWVGLVADKYDNTLWRHCLHRAFRANGPQRRKQVHGRLNAIRRFRNRIAHHEPIFQQDLFK